MAIDLASASLGAWFNACAMPFFQYIAEEPV